VVPLRLNLYQYRQQVRQAILQRKASLTATWDPMIAAWLAYALIQDGVDQNPHLSELIQDLERWAQENMCNIGRYLSPVCFLWYLQQQRGQVSPGISSLAIERITSVDQVSKFSPLRAPEQMFLIALMVSSLGDAEAEIKTLLVKIIQDQLYGPMQRRIMFLASEKELGQETQLYIPPDVFSDAGDVIALVWWHERYGKTVGRKPWWKIFDNIADNISLVEKTTMDEVSETRILSSWEIAILYESLVRETSNPDPSMLFELYTLHPRIRAISETLFSKGEYLNAVFEATKAFNDFLRERTGSHESETALVRYALGDPSSKEIKDPKIKFNPLDPTSQDYKSQQNEQRGLSYLAYGVFFAFRHPKGHEPKDTQWGNITYQEALDQLSVISYLMKRIEEAK